MARHSYVPIWFCSGWGLPCPVCCQTGGVLLPHHFTLTMAGHGGIFSVALSLGLPPPGVTRHPDPVEPGLSSPLDLEGQGSSHLTI